MVVAEVVRRVERAAQVDRELRATSTSLDRWPDPNMQGVPSCGQATYFESSLLWRAMSPDGCEEGRGQVAADLLAQRSQFSR